MLNSALIGFTGFFFGWFFKAGFQTGKSIDKTVNAAFDSVWSHMAGKRKQQFNEYEWLTRIIRPGSDQKLSPEEFEKLKALEPDMTDNSLLTHAQAIRPFISNDVFDILIEINRLYQIGGGFPVNLHIYINDHAPKVVESLQRMRMTPGLVLLARYWLAQMDKYFEGPHSSTGQSPVF